MDVNSASDAADKLVHLLKHGNFTRARLSQTTVCKAMDVPRFPGTLYRDLQQAMELRGYMFAEASTGGFVVIEIEALSGAKSATFYAYEKDKN